RGEAELAEAGAGVGRAGGRRGPRRGGGAFFPGPGTEARGVSALALLLALAVAAPAEPPDSGRTVQPESVERKVLPDKVRLGDPFVYRLDIHHPAAQRWELRTPPDLGTLRLLD